MKKLLKAFKSVTPQAVTEPLFLENCIEVVVGHVIYNVDKNGMVYEKHGALLHRTAISQLLTHNLRRELGYESRPKKREVPSGATLRKDRDKRRLGSYKKDKRLIVSRRGLAASNERGN